MKIIEYQLAELERARALQDEMAKLHIPSPVLSWQYEIKSKDGSIEEKGIGKSNSFTRNALNMMAYQVACCDYGIYSSTSSGDGICSLVCSGGTKTPIAYAYRFTNKNGVVLLGTSSSAEGLDNITVPSSGLTLATTSISTSFNATTRKLITTLSRAGANNTGSTINIVEAGVAISENYSNAQNLLMIRDVFDAIAVTAGHTLTWTYVTEVSYPNS